MRMFMLLTITALSGARSSANADPIATHVRDPRSKTHSTRRIEAERALAQKRFVEARALYATLAGRFAAKEAWSKCLDGARGVPWHDVQVLANPSGRPHINVRGQAAERCARLGVVRTHLSITHDAGVAAAVVVLEGA